MTFTKFVEIGRVVLVNYGSYVGKTAVILDIINDKRVIISGPTTGVPKQDIPIRRLSLTNFKINDVLRGQRSGLLKKKNREILIGQKMERIQHLQENGKPVEERKIK
eukprot:TRINITY_DN0_c187_g3_i1.p3 TRINITY_DN0_c187_g3~~TRINITY_DN0_c187_g3_i1.p3  ORF type:complete len:107 (+),score=16.36 TRINITY_DN0_c187_g3_i1:2-322(+)